MTAAWHFAPDNVRTRYSNEPIAVGEWVEVEGELVLCRNGLHASKRIMDALRYAPGALCCRVEVEGDIIHGDDKLVGRRRRVLWMVDATKVLHEFACRCAEDALALIDSPDPRSLAAIETKRQWLRGEATDADLAAAWVAARDAARDAAWVAARYAAWVAARDAQNRRLTSMVVAEAKRQGVYP